LYDDINQKPKSKAYVYGDFVAYISQKAKARNKPTKHPIVARTL
jgi:hypothetical protein